MLHVRTYGTSGPFVVVLHGGPGAPGYMAPVARALAGPFQVLEPMQRGSGGEPLTVAQHVDDLHALVEERCGDTRPALVGHSWGAMLALAYAAAHPGRVNSVVLISCGTFDPAARERMRAVREERTDDSLRRRIERLPEEFPKIDDRLRAMADIMEQLQEQGVYPGAFASIHEPVIMLHGEHDPHPGRMIRASLEPYLPQLEYREWERCGHYPWLEKAARDEFIVALRDWLARQFA